MDLLFSSKLCNVKLKTLIMLKNCNQYLQNSSISHRLKAQLLIILRQFKKCIFVQNKKKYFSGINTGTYNALSTLITPLSAPYFNHQVGIFHIS